MCFRCILLLFYMLQTRFKSTGNVNLSWLTCSMSDCFCVYVTSKVGSKHHHSNFFQWYQSVVFFLHFANEVGKYRQVIVNMLTWLTCSISDFLFLCVTKKVGSQRIHSNIGFSCISPLLFLQMLQTRLEVTGIVNMLT